MGVMAVAAPGWPVYHAELTRELLDPQELVKALQAEVEYLRQIQIHHKAPARSTLDGDSR